jgi:class 3 adenylate cyclase
MRELPRGTVTFLFTDIEGSTRLLKELGEAYGAVLAEHQRLLREAFEAAGSQEIDTRRAIPSSSPSRVRRMGFEEPSPGSEPWRRIAGRRTLPFALAWKMPPMRLETPDLIASCVAALSITDVRFLLHLPAIIPRTAGLPPREAFCAAQPLEL